MSPIKGKNLSNNYYDILEVSMSVDEDELRRAYDRIKSIYSEDSLAIYGLYTKEEIKDFRTQLEQAFRVLIDPENRREYDRSLISEPVKKSKQRVLTVSAKQQETEENKEQDEKQPEESQEEKSESKKDHAEEQEEVSAETANSKIFDFKHPNIEVPDDAVFSGEYLQTLRKDYGINLRLVSDTTKVSMTNLRLLEAEEWSKLPAMVYVKGFIVQYAKFLGLDSKRIVKDLVSRYEKSKDYQQT